MNDYLDWSEAGWRRHLPGVGDVASFVAGLGGETIPALAAAAAAAARVAGWLARRIRPGDRVLLAAGSSIGFVRCYLGALRAGAVVLLANPGYTAAELGYLAAHSGAVLAFADRGPADRLGEATGLPGATGLGGGTGLPGLSAVSDPLPTVEDRKSTRLNSSHMSS